PARWGARRPSTGWRRARSYDRGEDARDEPGVETRHEVVADDAEPPLDAGVDLPRREGLHHVEEPEQHERHGRREPGARQHDTRDDEACDLVDHDVRMVFRAEHVL